MGSLLPLRSPGPWGRMYTANEQNAWCYSQESLEARNHKCTVVPNKAAALETVKGLLSTEKSIFLGGSTTLSDVTPSCVNPRHGTRVTKPSITNPTKHTLPPLTS